MWKTDPQNALEETLHFCLRVSPYRCARCDMRFMDAKQHTDVAPPTRFSRWMSSVRSVASRTMIFSRKAPFQDELKLRLTSFTPPTVASVAPKHRETRLADAVEHLTSAS